MLIKRKSLVSVLCVVLFAILLIPGVCVGSSFFQTRMTTTDLGYPWISFKDGSKLEFTPADYAESLSLVGIWMVMELKI